MDMIKKFSFPLERPHCGIPMANGNFGVLVWGENTLNLTVNRADFWDHRGGEHLSGERPYAALVEFARKNGCGPELSRFMRDPLPPETPGVKPSRIPVGRFELEFQPGTKLKSAELDYLSGGVTVYFADGTELILEMTLRKHLLRVHDPAQKISGVRCVSSWEMHRAKEQLLAAGFAPPQMRPDGWTVRCPDPADGELKMSFVRRKDCWLFFFGDETPERVEEELEFSRSFWHELFSGLPEFTLPGTGWSEFYRYCVWRFACAASPFGYAAGLQGPWIEEYQPAQWSGDYHFNVNVQMFYGAALAIGRADFLLPLFDMLESEAFSGNLRRNSQALFGDDSAYYFTHAVDDRGVQCGGISCGSCLDPVCGGWTAMLYYGYWRQTGDRAFLAERAYPFIRKVMRGYELMLDSDFNLPLAISAEYASSNPDSPVAGRNPSYQLAAMRTLAAVLIELSGELGIPAEPLWGELLRRMPKFSTVEGRDRYGAYGAELHVAIWEGQELEHCHRHHSHLATLYPFPDPEPFTEAERLILDDSADHWIELGFGQWSEWCMMWAIELFCRLGFSEAPEMMLDLWKKLFVNEGDAVVYLPRSRGVVAHRRHDMVLDKRDHEIMQLDGVGGFISAYTSMFCYSENGKVWLFRGIPESRRPSASFRNVPLPGGYRISADCRQVELIDREGKIKKFDFPKTGIFELSTCFV